MPDSFHGNIWRIHQVDAVKIAAAIENDLRGIDVHDGDVAAENLADSNGLKDSLNREVFATHRRVQGQRIADLQRVAIGKRAGKQDGIGTRKKDERVGDFGLRFIELVIAQLLIASGVDAENEEVSFFGEGRARDDLDNRLSDFYAGSRADRFKDFFRKTCFARGDLQCGFAGNLFDGEAERVEQGDVGSADGKKYRNAQRNAHGGQEKAETMIPPLLPANVPERQKH